MHPQLLPKNVGWVEVIVGCMFSGKTEELIRRLRRAQIARQRVQIFKPAIDVRFANDHPVSHSEMRIPPAILESAREEIDDVNRETEVVGIDEGQFFDAELPAVCNRIADMGKRVLVAGLDQDYRGVPFEPMAKLLAVAEYVTKNLAICVICGNPANRNQRVTSGKKRIEVGSTDKYEARCRRCFRP